jgi:hypothetical protein
MRRLFVLALVSLSTACGASAIEQRAVSPEARRPVSAARVALPAGSRATAVWVGPRGDGLIALRDGRVVSVDARGVTRTVDRFPGEVPSADEAPIATFAARRARSPLALVPGGALLVDRGMVRRAPLPAFLRSARAFTSLGAEALWATPAGLYTSQGDTWLAIDVVAPQDVAELVPFGARDAWVRVGSELRRLRVDAGAPPMVTWLDATPGVATSGVRSIARVDAERGAIASSEGVTVVGASTIRVFHGETKDGAPDVVGGGGGFAWVGWAGQILRTDGERWESLVAGVALGPGAQIGVDDASGAVALVLDANGDVLRVVVEETMRSSGLSNGDVVVDTRLELEALPPLREAPVAIDFVLDGGRSPLASRKEAPWGWAEGGGRARDIPNLAFGAHRVDIVGHFRSGETTTETIRFDYASPLGRVPLYGADVVPIFASHCARCHANGVARDLSSYAALSSQAALVRASVREARMPPDILLDRTSVAILTAWVDGNAPK